MFPVNCVKLAKVGCSKSTLSPPGRVQQMLRCSRLYPQGDQISTLRKQTGGILCLQHITKGCFPPGPPGFTPPPDPPLDLPSDLPLDPSLDLPRDFFSGTHPWFRLLLDQPLDLPLAHAGCIWVHWGHSRRGRGIPGAVNILLPSSSSSLDSSLLSSPAGHTRARCKLPATGV